MYIHQCNVNVLFVHPTNHLYFQIDNYFTFTTTTPHQNTCLLFIQSIIHNGLHVYRIALDFEKTTACYQPSIWKKNMTDLKMSNNDISILLKTR